MRKAYLCRDCASVLHKGVQIRRRIVVDMSVHLYKAFPLRKSMNTHSENCERSGLRSDISSRPVAMTQSPAISPSNSTEREPTRPVAYGNAAVEATRCHYWQQKEPQSTTSVQRGMHHDPRQRPALDVPLDVTAGPGIPAVRSLFGEPPSRAQLDRLFNEGQQQVCQRSLLPLSVTSMLPSSLLKLIQSSFLFKLKPLPDPSE